MSDLLWNISSQPNDDEDHLLTSNPWGDTSFHEFEKTVSCSLRMDFLSPWAIAAHSLHLEHFS